MKQVQDAYIVAATRTPIGKSGRGYFRNTRPDDLLVAAVGRRHMVTADWVKPGAVVADIGALNRERVQACIARLNSDGSSDATFNPGTGVSTGGSISDFVNKIR